MKKATAPKVVKLDTWQDKVNEDALGRLENLVNYVKQNGCRGFAYTIVRRDGSVETNYSISTDFPSLVGGVQILSHRMLENRGPEKDA